MSRSIESTLLSLMPSHGSVLPPPLVQLASSLLAQSRHHASALKAEEEIARNYACCEIACDRSKIQLNLPPIESRPPIPPRVYKRLYAHLDNVLPKTSARTPQKAGTPRSSSARIRSAGNTPMSSRPTPSRVTPSKDKSLAHFRSDQNTPTKSAHRASAVTAGGQKTRQDLLPWVQPTIRFMCRESQQSKLAPSVLAAAESIVTPGGKRSRDQWIEDNLPALCGALYFFVVQQIWKLETGKDIESDRYVEARKEILNLLARAKEEVGGKGLDNSDTWEGWRIIKPREFDAAISEVTDRGWLEQDWFRGLEDVAASISRHDVHIGDAPSEAGDETLTAEKRVQRADTMFQDRYDFLTDEKRKKYRIWKEGIQGRIAQLERHEAESMDIDVQA